MILGLPTTDWQALTLSFIIASASTILLMITTVPFSWWFSQKSHWTKPFLEGLLTTPLVLPPTVLGFFLLILWSPHNLFGEWLHALGIPLVFHPLGLICASYIYCFPLVFLPLCQLWERYPKNLYYLPHSWGYTSWKAFLHFTLPHVWPSLLLITILGFAHALGEFGVLLIVGGNIPGQTQVASIKIFEYIEVLDFSSSYKLCFIFLALALILTTLSALLRHHISKRSIFYDT